MRQQAQAEGGAGGIPHPVIVGRQHPETVVAGGQVGVKGGPPVAGLDPAAVEALQLVPVLHLLRGHKAQPRILEFEPVSARLDMQLFVEARAWSSTRTFSIATGGGTRFSGMCAGSMKLTPSRVANHRLPSPSFQAAGWPPPLHSRMFMPSAVP